MLINRTNPAVICLSETHITNTIHKSELIIENYRLENCLSISRHTGGVSMYIREDLKYSRIIEEVLDYNYWIMGIKTVVGSKPYMLITVYHSPSSSHSKFIEAFEELVNRLDVGNSTLIIIGDFNVNIAVNTFYKTKLLECINRLGLYQIMNQFTRVTKDSSTMIDLIVTNNRKVQYGVFLTPKITDHSIIAVYLQESHEKKGYFKSVRQFKKFIDLDFQLDLMKVEWDSIITNVDVMVT